MIAHLPLAHRPPLTVITPLWIGSVVYLHLKISSREPEERHDDGKYRGVVHSARTKRPSPSRSAPGMDVTGEDDRADIARISAISYGWARLARRTRSALADPTAKYLDQYYFCCGGVRPSDKPPIDNLDVSEISRLRSVIYARSRRTKLLAHGDTRARTIPHINLAIII